MTGTYPTDRRRRLLGLTLLFGWLVIFAATAGPAAGEETVSAADADRELTRLIDEVAAIRRELDGRFSKSSVASEFINLARSSRFYQYHHMALVKSRSWARRHERIPGPAMAAVRLGVQRFRLAHQEVAELLTELKRRRDGQMGSQATGPLEKAIEVYVWLRLFDPLRDAAPGGKVELSLTTRPEPVRPAGGSPVVFRLTLINRSPNRAADGAWVEVAFTSESPGIGVPARFIPDVATCAAAAGADLGDQSEERNFRCEVGTIPPGDTAEVWFSDARADQGHVAWHAAWGGANAEPARQEERGTLYITEGEAKWQVVASALPAEIVAGSRHKATFTFTNIGTGPSLGTEMELTLFGHVTVDAEVVSHDGGASCGVDDAKLNVQCKPGAVEPYRSFTVTMEFAVRGPGALMVIGTAYSKSRFEGGRGIGNDTSQEVKVVEKP